MKTFHYLCILTALGGLMATGDWDVSETVNAVSSAVSGNSFDIAYATVADFEGGYVNHPNDPGGATNYGIIQRTFDAWRDSKGRPREHVSNISKEEARQIIYENYWLAGNCDEKPLPLAVACLDTVTNFGVAGGISFFSNLPSNPTEAAVTVAERRLSYRYQRVAEDPSQGVFREGWVARDQKLMTIIKDLPK